MGVTCLHALVLPFQSHTQILVGSIVTMNYWRTPCLCIDLLSNLFEVNRPYYYSLSTAQMHFQISKIIGKNSEEWSWLIFSVSLSCRANFRLCLSCLPSSSVLYSVKSEHGWHSVVTEQDRVHRKDPLYLWCHLLRVPAHGCAPVLWSLFSQWIWLIHDSLT